ncbi:hypothetical protein BH24GEM1_BH24GEM1_31270 [soil metagenome]
MDSPGNGVRLVVRAALAVLEGRMSPAVWEAVTTIPGVPTQPEGAAWALRLGPDRAESLARLADALSIPIDAQSARELADMRSRRDLASPVIEITTDGAGVWLSLMEDWRVRGLDSLRALPGGRDRPEAGRFEVALDAATANPIDETVRVHELRLSPAAGCALGELLVQRADGHGRVSMDDGAGFALVAARPGSPLALAVAAIPGARAIEQPAGRWLIRATPQSARELRRLAVDHEALSFDSSSDAWLREAPEWIARVVIDDDSDEPRLRVLTRWGDPPTGLREIDGLDLDRLSHGAPSTAANLAALDRLRGGGSELGFAPAVDRSLAWLQRNPGTHAVPPAELDLVVESGVPRLRVEAVSDEGAELAFLQWETALLRKHRELMPHADELPASAWPPDMLARFIALYGVGCTPAAARLVEAVTADDADAERLLALSCARDADLTVEGLGGQLMPFQRAGVAYALERRRVFLADEQGLGKTIQALATVQAEGAYPAVVICPASLKLNWVREATAWLPQRSSLLVTGRGRQSLADADIVVVNYEIVGAHLDGLAALEPASLILDEAHYVKNPRAARTRSVLELAERLGPDALRLALTGTPIVNQPAELASQLRALDRLAEYGSARSFQRGYRTDRERRRLHRRLRCSCYLRRRKVDVLDQLPEKRRAVVTIPLDNEPEYRRAEKDFARWLHEQMAHAKGAQVPQRTRAQALVRMNALRRLAARGKLAAALSWLADFRESRERIVVFAHHRDIQAGVLERFPDSARIVGTDSVDEREANVRRFQGAEGPPMCICSLEVAAHGFTLTAAANVAFLELAWTPAKHDQAEDRTHRIGQTTAVTAWYLLAAGTIDERIAELLEAKREVVGSLTDGGSGGGTSLVAALIGTHAR